MNLDINLSLSSQFHSRLSSKKFQTLCRDLLERKFGDEVSLCEEYGKDGQSQKGIDILVSFTKGHIHVAQCKRYKEITVDNIKTVSKDFLPYLDYWKQRNIKRFTLIVSTDFDDKNITEEILSQQQIFLKHSIEYEVWTARRLKTELSPHPDLVKEYLGSEVLDSICGSRAFNQPTSTQSPAIQSDINTLANRVTPLVSFAQSITNKEIDEIKEFYRNGNSEMAMELAEKKRYSDVWEHLNTQTKTDLLAILATLAINKDNDIERARLLLQEMFLINPEGDHTKTAALITYHEDGPEEAIKIIENTISKDSLHLKLAFMIERGMHDSVLDILENPPPNFVPDIETKRLQALALLSKGNLQTAKEVIYLALDEKPNWVNLKTVAAIVDYYSGLSPIATPNNYLLAPEPVHWNYVKRDEESVNRFQSSGEHFADLLKQNIYNKNLEQVYQVFRLACLANQPNSQDIAIDYCKQILEHNPTHPYILSWAIARNYDVDFESSHAELLKIERKLKRNKEQSTKIDLLLIILALSLKLGKFRQAEKLLETRKEEIFTIGDGHFYYFWKAQIQAISGRPDEVLKWAQKVRQRDLRFEIKAMARRVDYIRKKLWKPFIRHLERAYNKTGKGIYLAELCQTYAEKKCWKDVAQRAEELIETVNTADAVRLSAICCYNARYFSKCLDLLNTYQHYFPSNTLPQDLRSLRVQCQSSVGAFTKAVEDAEQLFRESPSIENLIVLMETQTRKADLNGLVRNAHKLLGRDEDIAPEHFLKAAELVQIKDLDLAISLWRRAKDRVLDDPALLSHALSLSYTLGVESEARHLFRKMQENARNRIGPFFTKKLKDFIPELNDRTEHSQLMMKSLLSGEFPLPLYAIRKNIPLSFFYHSNARLSRENKRDRERFVLVRHGGRLMPSDISKIPAPTWKINMDITALFTASELGILEKIENTFGPIKISPSLNLAVLNEQRKCNLNQKTTVEKAKKVCEMLEKQKLKGLPEFISQSDKSYSTLRQSMGDYWVDLVVLAKEQGGLLIEHLPLKSHDSEMKRVTLPKELNQIVINCRLILDGLHNSGLLTDAKYESAKEALGTEGNIIPATNPPQPGAKLFLSGLTASLLADADVLEQTCDNYDTHVVPFQIRASKEEVENDENRHELSEWLDKLREHLSLGDESGKYVPVTLREEELTSHAESTEFSDYVVEATEHLLTAEVEENDVVWIDERVLNAYATRVDAPIITITDILIALRLHQAISDNEYYNLLLRLRASKFRYIPLTKDEVLYHLNEAKIVEGNLVETDALAILRRYQATALFSTDILRIPNKNEVQSGVGEFPFILESTRAVDEAICAVWANENDDDKIARARADWLWNNLYTGSHGTLHLMPEERYIQDSLYYAGLDIGGLCARALEITTIIKKEPLNDTRIKLYFDWLNRKLILPRTTANPYVKATAVKFLTGIFENNDDIEINTQNSARIQYLYQSLFVNLPKVIRDEINLSEKKLTQLGITVDMVVDLGGVTLPSSLFWKAAEKAMQGKAGTVTHLGKTYKIAKNLDTPGVLGLKVLENNNVVRNFNDPVLPLLDRSSKKRASFLYENKFWFDCEEALASKEIDEISAIKDCRERISRVQKWMDKSAEVFYGRLEHKISTNRAVEKSMLLDYSTEGLLSHYRIKSIDGHIFDSQNVHQSSVEQLLADEGLETTIIRASNLPVKLPSCILKEVKKLSTEKRVLLFKKLSTILLSPINRLHLIWLSINCYSNQEEVIEFAGPLLEKLYDLEEGKEEFELFEALLHLISENLGIRPEIESWPTNVRLIVLWGHASRIFNILRRFFHTKRDFIEYVFSPRHDLDSEIFLKKPDYWYDCAHPMRFNRKVFLTHGVASLLGEAGTELLQKLSIPELIIKELTMEWNEGVIGPHIAVLEDTSLLKDSLKSIFGGDRGFVLSKAIIDTSIAESFQPDNIKIHLKGIMSDLLKDQKSFGGWFYLRYALRDLPTHQDLKKDLELIIKNTKIESILEKELITALEMLAFVCRQAPHLSEDSRIICANWIIFIAKKLSSYDSDVIQMGEITEEKKELMIQILDNAMALSIYLGDARKSSEFFARIVVHLIDVWEEVRNPLQGALSRMVYELPVSKQHGLWRALLACRVY